MPTTYTEELPVTLSAYRSSIDGSIVVQIDQEDSPSDDNRIRVFLNDGAVFDGDTSEVSVFDPLEAGNIARHLEAALAIAKDDINMAFAVSKAVAFLRGEKS